MNFPQCLLLLLMIPAFGCGPEYVVEEAGLARYFLDNQSSHALRIEWTGAPPAPTEPPNGQVVPGGTRRQFIEDGMFGGRPNPSNTFQSLALYRVDASSPDYLQEPIQNERWVEEIVDPGTYGIAHYTLNIRDEDLQP
ncbi:hypothetical protein POL68_09205 [Stigmatella sp. ncwal1]|uniref:Lipoprotein n=1 Tax=Stigmatella ashevillensis TaxID=2995309 RepID=A0ABT5D4P6_9BACT|nr:hypothetical protein [Stigmatella ashevillena]MDC0708644.1 hypothetical protein [Stigmatella ashevillena]